MVSIHACSLYYVFLHVIYIIRYQISVVPGTILLMQEDYPDEDMDRVEIDVMVEEHRRGQSPAGDDIMLMILGLHASRQNEGESEDSSQLPKDGDFQQQQTSWMKTKKRRRSASLVPTYS